MAHLTYNHGFHQLTCFVAAGLSEATLFPLSVMTIYGIDGVKEAIAREHGVDTGGRVDFFVKKVIGVIFAVLFCAILVGTLGSLSNAFCQDVGF